jgi:hypothetical protein
LGRVRGAPSLSATRRSDAPHIPDRAKADRVDRILVPARHAI